MNALVWGTGNGTRGVEDASFVRDCQILAYVDNNPAKWGMEFKGKKIIPPSQVADCTFDFIIIANMFFDQIKVQLLEMGIKASTILHYDHSDPDNSLSKIGRVKLFNFETFDLNGFELKKNNHIFEIKGFLGNDMHSPISMEKQVVLVEKLLKCYHLAKMQADFASDAYRVGVNWNNFLKTTRKEFYKVVEKDDVQELTILLNNFCRNCLSTGILGGEEAISFIQKNIETVYSEFLHNFKVWMYSVNRKIDLNELEMPPIGNPYGFDVDGHLININCFWNHYRAQFCSKLTSSITRPVIAEIGGGFGGFAYFLLKTPGEKIYIDFDLPENLLNISYYLSLAFPEKRILLYEDEHIILDSETINRYDIILMPNYMLPSLADLSVDFVINTISLSEMEYDTITEYINQVSRICKSFFYHENLADAPQGYKGFPASVFPVPEGFEEMVAAISRWATFDSYAKHIYKEILYTRV